MSIEAQNRMIGAWEELECELLELREFKAKHAAEDCGRANLEKKVKAAENRALDNSRNYLQTQKWLNEVREERDTFRQRMHELEERLEEFKAKLAEKDEKLSYT